MNQYQLDIDNNYYLYMSDNKENHNIKMQIFALMSTQLNTLSCYFNNKMPMIEFDKLGKLLHMQLDLANSMCVNTDKIKENNGCISSEIMDDEDIAPETYRQENLDESNECEPMGC